jgi:NADH-quinone oxidoreductase subunit J
VAADWLLFWVFAPISVGSAALMLLQRNAVHAALLLIVNFFTVAVFFLLLGSEFLFVVQIIVYAGAIMVLFLFVIMLLGAESLPKSKVLPWQRPLAIGLAVLLGLEAAYLLLTKARPAGTILPDAAANTSENLRQLGLNLFNEYLLPFEVVSILLLVAMVGAIILTKKEKEARQ